MGQKIHPKGFRTGTVFTWNSRWFADKKRYKELLIADIHLRQSLFLKLKSAGLANVTIERSINKINITLHVSRPGVVIGRGGSGMEMIKKYIETFLIQETVRNHKISLRSTPMEATRMKVDVTVEPVKEPNLDAYLVATNIADQLAKRLPHKRVCNQALDRMMSAGAGGARILLGGRINGAEIARREKFQSGTVPLSTIREDIDFAAVPSLTKSGYIGVKVWICRKTN